MEIKKLFLLQSFALAWHWANSIGALTEDKISYKMLGEKEYQRLKANCQKVSKYFYTNADRQDSLKLFMNQYICPLPVANQVFSEVALKNAIHTGTRQLVLINNGNSSLPYRIKKVKLFKFDEICGKDVLYELNNNHHFDKAKPAFVMLGSMPVFTEKEDFSDFITGLGNMLCAGSSVVFSYGDEKFYTDNSGKVPQFIKEITDCPRFSGYSYDEMEKMLSQGGFLIYEYVTSEDMQHQYFDDYNLLNTQNLTAVTHINYILAVKKEHRL